MHILITGHQGYLGPVIARHLKQTIAGVRITGWDNGYFAASQAMDIAPFLTAFDTQRQIDLRNVTAADFTGFDAIVHLAGISNDPIGNEFEAVTMDVNAATSGRLAQLAKTAGVTRFLFASSCMVYGWAEGGPRKESDDVAPLTAYSKSKVAAENTILPLADDQFQVTCLRFSTAYGLAPILRLDLVINDFVASAVTTGKIEILSDGSPWRPLIHVTDMARAVEYAATRTNGPAALAMNVGSAENTWQIKDLAHDVANVLGNVDVSINTAALPDKRSYKVDFSLFQELAPNHQPIKSFADAVGELRDGITALNLPANFRQSPFIRLVVLRGLMDDHKIDKELRWVA